VTWGEVAGAVDRGDPAALRFEMGDVLERVGEHGDLFAPVLTLRQEIAVA
jgi:NTP pyrophosphatase (non-canonical NTP hydrolase)